MPVYEYQVVGAGGADGGRFEVEQGVSDPPLTVHPLTGEPVRRVLSAPHLAGVHNERRVRATLADAEHLARLGFTRYQRDAATGRYHQIGGDGGF